MDEDEAPVVVGYDGSAEADRAVDWAAMEAQRRQVRLDVLFAADTSGLSRPEVTIGRGQPDLDALRTAVAEAGAARARAVAPGLEVRTLTTGIGPASALMEASVRAAIIVVGGRARTRLAEMLLGSVEAAVIEHAACPVVVVPADAQITTSASRPVVVGYDGSESAGCALRAAARAATDRDVELVVVCAWQTPTADHWSRIYLADDRWRREEIQRAAEAATSAMERAREVLSHEYADLAVREVVVEGRPSVVLARESEGAGLVVVGARGQGDLASLLLGSVARNTVHRALCPVGVVR